MPHLPFEMRSLGRLASIGTWALAAVLAGCASPPPSTAPSATGAAGGATSAGADEKLQTCSETTGTVRLQDDQAAAEQAARTDNATIESVRALLRDINGYDRSRNSGNVGGVTLDSLRLLIQQSNCLVIVERGLTEASANDEKRRARSPNSEMRDDVNMGPGQEVGADFVLRGSVLSVNANENRTGFSLGGFAPFRALAGAGGSQSVSSADVQLVLIDVRSKVQLAVAQGHGTATNTSLATSMLGRIGGGLGAGQFKTESNTPQTKIVLEAYADAYNKLVPALRNYKAQVVKGGLGAGGTLKVQGSQGDPSRVKK